MCSPKGSVCGHVHHLAAHGRDAGLLHVVGQVEVDAVIALLLLLSDGNDVLVHAVNEDLSLGVRERGHERDQVRHGLVHGAAVHAGVQVLRGALDADLEVCHAA